MSTPTPQPAQIPQQLHQKTVKESPQPTSSTPSTKPPKPTPPIPIPRQLPPPYDQPLSLHPANDERRRLHDDVVNYIHHLELSPEWIEVENRPWSNDNNRWVISGCQGYDFVQYDPRVRMRFFWNEELQILSGSVFWDNRTEGPAGGAYGGSIMLVFDEILAYPVWRSGTPAFTANVNLNLRKMIPFNTSAIFESKIIKRDGRKIFLEAKIMSAPGSNAGTDYNGIINAIGISNDQKPSRLESSLIQQQYTYADAKGLWISSSGIGSSSAVHPETIQQDKARLDFAVNQDDKYGNIHGNMSTLQYPMNASSGVIAATINNNDSDTIHGNNGNQNKFSLFAPQNNSVLPYQKQHVEDNLNVNYYKGKVFDGNHIPQAIEPKYIENNYQTHLYARL